MTKKHPLSWSADTAAKRLTDIENRLANKPPELDKVFTQLYLSDAMQQSTTVKAQGPLAGAIVTIKDLFDIKGKVTRAGTVFMANDTVAAQDAVPVAQLRKAGAVILGHTNMTELAYSGLGLNPHYGTPKSVLRPDCAPGGSSAGGAVSVATGLADIALGTDTGGSLRIPAAFNGIVGFKPTQTTVSRSGCKALSRTLDSVGPMAASVQACHLAYNVIRKSKSTNRQALERSLIIPDNFGMDDMQTEVAAAFDQAVSRLSHAGFKIETKSLKSLEHFKHLQTWQIGAVDALTEYYDAIQHRPELIDPRVISRIRRAEDVSTVMYHQALRDREVVIAEFAAEIGDALLLMPTSPILPPTLAELKDDEDYNRINMQVLRNTSIANYTDACSISLPLGFKNNITSLMLTAVNDMDESLLTLAAECEHILRKSSD